MRIPRPRSLNGLILVGFGLVALPLLIAVLWALFNLDRLVTQSEELVVTGVAAAENNRLLTERIGSLERVARQYLILRNPDSLLLLQQDLVDVEARLQNMRPLTEKANTTALLGTIGDSARRIGVALSKQNISAGEAQVAISEFVPLRQQVSRLTRILSAYVDAELRAIQEITRKAQKESAWK